MNNQESPRLAWVYMVAASLQFSTATGRFLPIAIASNGWLFSLVLLAITTVFLGLATGLQRILMPNSRTAFAFRYLMAGIAISLINSIAALIT